MDYLIIQSFLALRALQFVCDIILQAYQKFAYIRLVYGTPSFSLIL